MHSIVIHYFFQLYTIQTQWVKNVPAMQEMSEIWVWFLGGEDPLEEGMPTQSHGQRSLVGYSPWVRRVGRDCSDWAQHSTQRIIAVTYGAIHYAYLLYTDYFVDFMLLNCPSSFPLYIKSANNDCCRESEKRETLCIVGGNVN